ncbi:hypothetical protein H0H81_010890 [Sphagnurus paluster]|uniref:Transmembrane protein n=1 Tax=Sphagnurus paluster TaxID=117069 RepID=A0A9P7GPP9_9AGAR|nr:hypothetical protein H0H81_010890 [Sphagnurus paluster]
MASIILDQAQAQLVADGGEWTTLSMERYYAGSAIVSSFASTEFGDTGQYGRLAITFQGTQIALFGSSPPARASQNIEVSIDGGAPYTTTYGDASPPSVLQWFQSPLLPDGTHTLLISHIAGASLDYLVATPGPSTPLDAGQQLIVDDGDAAITYAGPWTRKGGQYQTGEQPYVTLTYGGAVHQAQGKGATALFQFTGTAVALYGVQDYSHLGTMQVVYTLDGVAYPQTHTVSLQTPQYRAAVIQRGNTVLFASPAGTLAAGNHTLKVEVLSLAPQMSLMLDYIVYTPSLAGEAGSGKAKETGAGTGSGTTASVPTSDSTSWSGGGVPVGAVAGGAVAGVLVLALVLFLCVRWWRRRRRTALDGSSSVSSWGSVKERADLLRVAPFMEESDARSHIHSHSRPRTPVSPGGTSTHSNSRFIPTPSSTPTPISAPLPIWSHFRTRTRSRFRHGTPTITPPPYSNTNTNTNQKRPTLVADLLRVAPFMEDADAGARSHSRPRTPVSPGGSSINSGSRFILTPTPTPAPAPTPFWSHFPFRFQHPTPPPPSPPPPTYYPNPNSRAYTPTPTPTPTPTRNRTPTPAQRMHEAVAQLNREITASGGEETPRVGELRARVEAIALGLGLGLVGVAVREREGGLGV